MNSVTITAAMTADPELRYTNAGKAMATFTVYESFKPDGGERVYKHFDCVMFGEGAEFFCESAMKGDNVILQGRLDQDKWETDAGEKRSKVKLIVNDAGLSVRFGPVTPTRAERS